MTMWTRRPPYRLIAAVVLLLASACGSTHEAQSGETHFLRACKTDCEQGFSCVAGACTRECESDRECGELAAGASCEVPLTSSDRNAQRSCALLCEGGTDCTALGSRFACMAGHCREQKCDDPSDLSQCFNPFQPGPPPESACGPDCVMVSGYAEDPKRGCVDRTQLGQLGCDCNPDAAFGRCVRDTATDTLWVVRASDDGLLGVRYQRCSLEESDRMTAACDFAHCEHRPLSVCTLEATCADRGCDNLEFFADGCRRTPCADDAACNADERCVALECTNTSACTVSDPGPSETCGCAGPDVCNHGGACNPIESAGPRGAWHKLELISGSSQCPPERCYSFYEITPQGSLTIKLGSEDPAPKFVIVSPEDLKTITSIVDGPELRVELRDGFACQFDGLSGGDGVASIRLELDDQTLEQPIERCRANEDTVVRLRDMLAAYR